MRSLRARLIALTLGGIAVVLLPFLVFSYLRTVDEVRELSDARLAQNARTIEALSAHAGFDAAGVPARLRRNDAPETVADAYPYETEVGFQYWKSPSALSLATADLRTLAFDAAPAGFADVAFDGHRWRVFTLASRDGGIVRAAERYDSRRDIARALLLQNIAPLLLGLPLLAALVAWAVRRGLRPLAAIAAKLDARAPDATEAVDTNDAPREVAPLLTALNGLLRRLHAVLDNERQFTANAAHELRTPLAGALVHLDNARAADDAAMRAEALGGARLGVERMTRIVNQMLDLARWDGAAARRDFASVDLGACVDAELAALGVAALDKDIEIVRDTDESARCVRGWEPGLRTLLRNLLDNAIRYGFAHGRIDIAIAACDGGTRLTVDDSGPGIAPSQREAMLERFRRGSGALSEGSGLGLSIVARIAQLHGASLALSEPENRHGLRVEVLFPAAATRPLPSSNFTEKPA